VTADELHPRLLAFVERDGILRRLADMSGTSEATLSRLVRGKQGKRSDPARLARIAAALDDVESLDEPLGRKSDRRLDDPDRLAEARDVQHARDPYYPFAWGRGFEERLRSFYALTDDDTDEGARLRHLVVPRVRAGLVPDLDAAGPRTRWFLGRLRLFRACRALDELADAARCWAETASGVAT
jgi:transcriptional regulator with XRE-family HTH domain